MEHADPLDHVASAAEAVRDARDRASAVAAREVRDQHIMDAIDAGATRAEVAAAAQLGADHVRNIIQAQRNFPMGRNLFRSAAYSRSAPPQPIRPALK